MQRFIGIDVHGQSCTLVVMGPSGRRLGEHVVETSAKALIERIRSIPGDKYVCMEEGTQSEWLYEVLESHVKQIVVTQPLKRAGSKSDAIDAWALWQICTGAMRWSARCSSPPRHRRRFGRRRAGISPYGAIWCAPSVASTPCTGLEGAIRRGRSTTRTRATAGWPNCRRH